MFIIPILLHSVECVNVIIFIRVVNICNEFYIIEVNGTEYIVGLLLLI